MNTQIIRMQALNTAIFELAFIRNTAVSKLGPGVEFRMRFVDRLDFEPGGKFRYRRSFVASEYGAPG